MREQRKILLSGAPGTLPSDEKTIENRSGTLLGRSGASPGRPGTPRGRLEVPSGRSWGAPEHPRTRPGVPQSALGTPRDAPRSPRNAPKIPQGPVGDPSGHANKQSASQNASGHTPGSIFSGFFIVFPLTLPCRTEGPTGVVRSVSGLVGVVAQKLRSRKNTVKPRFLHGFCDVARVAPRLRRRSDALRNVAKSSAHA